MRYIQYLSLLLLFFISCKNGNSQKKGNSIEIISKIDLKSFLGNEKWIEISKKDSKFINYKRCDSENRYIKIGVNDFTENVGQETFHCNIKSINKVSELEYILNINDGCAYDNSFRVEILDVEKKIVKWSNKLYSFISTSESMLGNYEIVNQPCTDCFSQEDCNEDDNLSNHSTNKFYKKPQTIVTPNSKWFGEYYFEDGQTGKSILITEKEMLYEANGMRYNAKYKLSANQVSDTLGLYYHKDFDGNNNNLDAYLPLIKLYSKQGKFFIRTVLTNESLKETEVEKF